MNKVVALALLVVGVLLLVWGFNASDSIGSELSEAVQGSPSNRSIVLIVGGVLCAIIGGLSLLRGARR